MKPARLRFFRPVTERIANGLEKSIPPINNSGDIFGFTMTAGVSLALLNQNSREFLFDFGEDTYDFFTGNREGFVEATGTPELWTTPEMYFVYAFIAIAIADRLGFRPLSKV